MGLQPTGLTRGGARRRRSSYLGDLRRVTNRDWRLAGPVIAAAEVSRGHSSRFAVLKARTVERSLKGGLLMGSSGRTTSWAWPLAGGAG